MSRRSVEETVVAHMHARLAKSTEEASAVLRAAAADQGWVLNESDSRTDHLVFQRPTSSKSWGSNLIADLDGEAGTETRVNIVTNEEWAFIDWGRGGHAARKLLKAVQAERL
jgi:hypothetical protein